MLKPGDLAPAFNLPCARDGKIASLALSEIKTDVVVVFFYPRDFSFICPTEVTGFHKALNSFSDEKAAIVGVSIDDAESHLRWTRELGGISYPLLADQDGKIAREYGVFDEQECVAVRATFILDGKRIVTYASACSLNVGRSVNETLRIVRALRTGHMCPADWQPGVELGAVNAKS
jgi:peroxiredoxin (alkyl hydroperoxide reductase subunit C)